MMMLARYILKTFSLYVVLSASALIGLLMVFDLLKNSQKVMAGKSAFAEPLLTYIGLRLPEIALLIFPLIILLAALLTLARFVSKQELVMMHNAGLSLYHIIGIMLGGGGVLAALYFTLSNWLLPQTAYNLRVWADGGYQMTARNETKLSAFPLWVAASNKLIHIKRASPDGKEIFDLTLVERNRQGKLLAYYKAKRAAFDENKKAWKFQQVTHSDVAKAKTIRHPFLYIPFTLPPDTFSRAEKLLPELSLAELRARQASEEKKYPDSVYALWIQKKIAAPLALLVMILLAMPIAFQLARQNNIFLVGAVIGAGGFAYFFFDNILFSLGEAGQLPAAIAVWGTPIIFTLIALTLAFTHEKQYTDS